jgi:membrane protein DedA with SNARE-associated domain
MVAHVRTRSQLRRLLLIVALLVVGLGLVSFFGTRAERAYYRLQQHQLASGTTDVEAIRGWMTLPYIAHAYGVPEDALFGALSIPKAGNERSSIKQLVTQYQRDPLTTRQTIQQVLLEYQRTPSGRCAMSELTDAFLTAMLVYGPAALALALLLAALGIPLPATLLLLAGGAFARQGVLDGALAATLGVLASVLGDSGSYCLGRCGGSLVLRRMDSTAAWRRAQATFERRGALAILLTRFLLTPLALPTNLIAGSSQYTFRRFLVVDLAGEIIWVALYGGLGYLFADRWEALSDLVGNLSGALLGLLILVVTLVLAYRSGRQRASAGRSSAQALTTE